jgi:hypothetical protein
MLRHRRLLVLVVLCALLGAAAPADAQLRRVATVDAVRLRAAPSATGAAVRTLEIATPLTVEGSASGVWVRVRTCDGAAGWVRRDLTVPYEASAPLAALRTIAERSLAREATPFSVRARLANVLTDAARHATAPGAKAELSLLRLRALQAALDAHAANDALRETDPVRTGRLHADSSELAYGDPQGQWLVRADAFWTLHDRHRALPIAERIAWAAASQMLPGECEADPTCIFTVLEMTTGRYLGLYPRGAHAATALAELAAPLEFLEEATRDPEAHGVFCTARGDDSSVTPSRIAAITRRVAASVGAGRGRALALLGKLRARCG